MSAKALFAWAKARVWERYVASRLVLLTFAVVWALAPGLLKVGFDLNSLHVVQPIAATFWAWVDDQAVNNLERFSLQGGRTGVEFLAGWVQDQLVTRAETFLPHFHAEMAVRILSGEGLLLFLELYLIALYGPRLYKLLARR